MTIDSSSSLGLGQVSREGMIILFETLNDALVDQATYWKLLDEELAQIRGAEYEPLVLEPVEPENFYLGHNPSLIEAPIEKYPNVAVDADRAGAALSDSLDQASMFGISLYIEFMVKSIKDEEEVSLRASRTLDAINTCITSNLTLRGAVQELDDTPTVQLSDVFVRDGETSYGDKWFWRGGRLEYSVKKVAQNPAGIFARPASTPDIDQS